MIFAALLVGLVAGACACAAYVVGFRQGFKQCKSEVLKLIEGAAVVAADASIRTTRPGVQVTKAMAEVCSDEENWLTQESWLTRK